MKAPHIFFSENLNPNGELRTFSYGKHKALTLHQVTIIKKLLPAGAIIIQCDFAEPENYIYPTSNEDKYDPNCPTSENN